MNMFSSSRGVSSSVVITITAVGLVIIMGGGYYYFSKTQGDVVCTSDAKICPDGTAVGRTGPNCEFAACPGVQPPPPGTSTNLPPPPQKYDDGGIDVNKLVFSGTVLAGSKSPLLDYNKADYEKALASDKLIVLYFYANWCPICKLEYPEAQKAFNALDHDGVVGFRINYEDTATTQDEIVLAREMNVTYQHTKVFIRNGKRLLKAPETWSADKYSEQIRQHLR